MRKASDSHCNLHLLLRSRDMMWKQKLLRAPDEAHQPKPHCGGWCSRCQRSDQLVVRVEEDLVGCCELLELAMSPWPSIITYFFTSWLLMFRFFVYCVREEQDVPSCRADAGCPRPHYLLWRMRLWTSVPQGQGCAGEGNPRYQRVG